ncbi:MAG TPA: cytochrome-c oxidase [Alphaproteobacteria bacterium]|jgi:cbb3-type cytochrome oxidase subunit 1
MSTSIERFFFRIAVLYALIGMCAGIAMAATQNFAPAPAHAHLLLLGWLSMFVYGIFYKMHPQTQGKLAIAQFWAANVGLWGLVSGIFLIVTGHHQAEPLAAVGGLCALLGMILFAVQVFRGTRT